MEIVCSRLSASNLASRIRAQSDKLKYWLTGFLQKFHSFADRLSFVTSHPVELVHRHLVNLFYLCVQ